MNEKQNRVSNNSLSLYKRKFNTLNDTTMISKKMQEAINA